MSEKLRIVFMGTPDFAVESLKMIFAEFNVVAVVTAPDKKRGRGQKIIATPVKIFAEQNNIPVLQPTNLKDNNFIEQLKQLNHNLNVVVAFRMLPEVVWNMPKFGSLNLHASLLPNYRGAAPINHAIINGEEKTGNTTFFLRHEIDTGDIILQQEVPISKTDNAGTLHDKLMISGAKLLVETLHKVENNTVEPKKQPSSITNLKSAPKIFKNDCRINWNLKGEEIYNFIRGLSPYPAAWTRFVKNGKVISAKIFDGIFKNSNDNDEIAIKTLLIDNMAMKVKVADGYYDITELQLESKKRISTKEFVKGLQQDDIFTLE